MPLEPHDSIQQPPSDTEIWRYYPTSQFLWVLQEQALYLTRLDQLDDPFEGYSPVENLKKEVNAQSGRSEFFEQLPDEINLGDPGERTSEKYEVMRRMALVNCWSMDEEDSLAMWKSYLSNNDGVAVRSTFGNLVDPINRESNFSYHAGEISYFDYFEDLKTTDNFFSFIMSKPKQYRYEEEVRVFVWWPTSGQSQLGDPRPGEVVSEDTLTAPTGKPMGVNLNSLIDGVYVSPFGPAWLTEEYWNDILDKYGIEASAVMSRLAMEPADVLNEN